MHTHCQSWTTLAARMNERTTTNETAPTPAKSNPLSPKGIAEKSSALFFGEPPRPFYLDLLRVEFRQIKSIDQINQWLHANRTARIQ